MAGFWEGWLSAPTSMTNMKKDIEVCRIKGSKTSIEQGDFRKVWGECHEKSPK